MSYLRKVFLDLPRPEHMANPEMLQSSLMWDLMSGKPDHALVYGKRDGYSGKYGSRSTRPETAEEWDSWNQSFWSQGLRPVAGSDSDLAFVGEAIADGLVGIRPTNAWGIAATPINPWAALMQDSRGMMFKDGPPDYGKIINILFAYGEDSDPVGTASSLWLKAHYGEVQGPGNAMHVIASAMGQYYANHIWPDAEVPVLSESREIPIYKLPLWLSREAVPFSWFNQAWIKLCSPEWFKSLPRRRWSDWASCILRTSLGCSYLWEMNFYHGLGSALVDDEYPVKEVSSVPKLLVWDKGSGVAERDIASRIKTIVTRGEEVMKVLEKVIERDEQEGGGALAGDAGHGSENGLHDWVSECRQRLVENDKEELQRALSVDPKDTNIWWAIKYALLCREQNGESADHYGLLMSKGPRYMIVEPRGEWLVAFCSLLCQKPGGSTRLGKVKIALRQIGVEVETPTLVEALEAQGLCKGSNDADEAIEVESGF